MNVSSKPCLPDYMEKVSIISRIFLLSPLELEYSLNVEQVETNQVRPTFIFQPMTLHQLLKQLATVNQQL